MRVACASVLPLYFSAILFNEAPFLSLSGAWHLMHSLPLNRALAASTSTAACAGVAQTKAKTADALARVMDDLNMALSLDEWCHSGIAAGDWIDYDLNEINLI